MVSTITQVCTGHSRGTQEGCSAQSGGSGRLLGVEGGANCTEARGANKVQPGWGTF